MGLQIVFVFEGLPTLITLKFPVHSMRSHMRSKSTRTGEFLPTFRTFWETVLFFPMVHPVVQIVASPTFEPSVADITEQGIIFRVMCAHVCFPLYCCLQVDEAEFTQCCFWSTWRSTVLKYVRVHQSYQQKQNNSIQYLQSKLSADFCQEWPWQEKLQLYKETICNRSAYENIHDQWISASTMKQQGATSKIILQKK